MHEGNSLRMDRKSSRHALTREDPPKKDVLLELSHPNRTWI
jgi:hypothetical protein